MYREWVETVRGELESGKGSLIDYLSTAAAKVLDLSDMGEAGLL